MSDQKNVLFIMLDQWRAECLSALGHAHVKTPNMDALATDGVLFTQHYCQAVPCGPSRASIYTGMYQHNHRSICNGTPLDARFSNIALELRKAGYSPVLFGLSDTSMDPREYPAGDPLMHNYERVLPGFETGVLTDGDHLPWVAYLKAKGYQFEQKEFFKPRQPNADQAAKGRTFAPAFFKAEHSSAAFLCDELIQYLSVRADTSWFAHLSIFAPHHPYIAPEPFNEMVEAEEVEAPIRRATMAGEAEQHPYLDYWLHHPGGEGTTYGTSAADNLSMSDVDIRQAKATYYGMISEVDQQIGRVIDHLKQTGAYDSTLIIVTSDHGDQLGDHWQFGKHVYFDQSIHIPLLIRDPSSNANKTRNQLLNIMTESVDIMPSILDWLDIDIPRQCDGQSLLFACYGKDIPEGWRTEIHMEYDFRDVDDFSAPGRGMAGLEYDDCMMTLIRDESFKYVHFSGLPALLFDLKNDPSEFNNLAEQADYQGVVLEYAQKLLSWRMKTEERTLSNMKLTPDGVRAYPVA